MCGKNRIAFVVGLGVSNMHTLCEDVHGAERLAFVDCDMVLLNPLSQGHSNYYVQLSVEML